MMRRRRRSGDGAGGGGGGGRIRDEECEDERRGGAGGGGGPPEPGGGGGPSSVFISDTPCSIVLSFSTFGESCVDEKSIFCNTITSSFSKLKVCSLLATIVKLPVAFSPVEDSNSKTHILFISFLIFFLFSNSLL